MDSGTAGTGEGQSSVVAADFAQRAEGYGSGPVESAGGAAEVLNLFGVTQPSGSPQGAGQDGGQPGGAPPAAAGAGTVQQGPQTPNPAVPNQPPVPGGEPTMSEFAVPRREPQDQHDWEALFANAMHRNPGALVQQPGQPLSVSDPRVPGTNQDNVPPGWTPEQYNAWLQSQQPPQAPTGYPPQFAQPGMPPVAQPWAPQVPPQMPQPGQVPQVGPQGAFPQPFVSGPQAFAPPTAAGNVPPNVQPPVGPGGQPLDPATALYIQQLQGQLALQRQQQMGSPQAPAPAAPTGPTGQPAAPAEAAPINLMVPTDVMQAITSDDPATAQRALSHLVSYTATAAYQRARQDVQQDIDTRLNGFRGTLQDEQRRQEVERDYYSNFQAHDNEYVRPIVQRVATELMAQTGITSWNPQFRNAVGQRVQQTLALMSSVAGGAVPQPQAPQGYAPQMPQMPQGWGYAPAYPAQPPAAPGYGYAPQQGYYNNQWGPQPVPARPAAQFGTGNRPPAAPYGVGGYNGGDIVRSTFVG